MKPDPLEKTVSIPVRVRDGLPKPLYGGEWPKLKEGAVGELTIPAYALPQGEAFLFNAPLRIPLLPAGTSLYLVMTATTNHDNLVDPSPKVLEGKFGNGFVLLQLDDELTLELRGTKKARLGSVKCHLPTLNLKADSVNEAYTLASGQFEPKRRAHTGNVFVTAFYMDSSDKEAVGLRPLDALRRAKEAVLEARFQQSESQI